MAYGNAHYICFCLFIISVYRQNDEGWGGVDQIIAPLKHIHGWYIKTMFSSRWLNNRLPVEIRGHLGQIWPTDPRHSWWKRNRCCGSPEDCRALTPGNESVAPILPSERNCPPWQRKKNKPVIQWERRGETDRREINKLVHVAATSMYPINHCCFKTLLVKVVEVCSSNHHASLHCFKAFCSICIILEKHLIYQLL